jgi:acyl carrier protein
VTPIATPDGLALLSRLLRDTIVRESIDADADTSDRFNRADRPAVFGVMPVAWGTFLKQFPAGVPSRFEMLAPATPESDDASLASASSSAHAVDSSNAAAAILALRALAPNNRQRRLQQMLRDTLAAVLGFGASVELGPREKYFDLGMDSLLSVEFRNRLQQTFSIALPATLAFDYPTLETLAERIDELLAERFRSDDSTSSSASSNGSGVNGTNGTANASTVMPATLAAASRGAEEAGVLDELPTDEIARLLAAELSEEAVRVR